MRAQGYGAATKGARLGPMEFDRREVGPDDVLIDIVACGVCHSDIHQRDGDWGNDIFPMVPGHEIVGTVSEVGAGVADFSIGDRVGVGCYVDSCRECDGCTSGSEQYCSRNVPTYNGMHLDGTTPTFGGYSNRIVVDRAYVLRLPDGLDFLPAAPLLCAGITLYPPLRKFAGPDKRVAILGLGGLGHVGVRIARAMGSHVTVLSHSPGKEADALRLGADAFVCTSDRANLKPLHRSFDVIVSTLSSTFDIESYLRLLKVNGTMVLVGLPVESFTLSAGSLISAGLSLVGSMIGGVAETQEMLHFCAEHGILADVEVIDIADVNEAWERVLASDVRYRFVIDIAKSLG